MGHEFQKKVEIMDKNVDYIIYCESGVRGGLFHGVKWKNLDLNLHITSLEGLLDGKLVNYPLYQTIKQNKFLFKKLLKPTKGFMW